MASVFVKKEPVDGSSCLPGDESPELLTTMPQDTYRNGRLEQLISQGPAGLLESGVSTGIRLLESLKAPLISALGADTHAAQWLEAIQKLEDKAKPTRTVIGVVGNTGAGKSSVINAILNEESLIPTNGMRACTASATEISWNHSNIPSQLYRAEVDFIKQKDWAVELNNLFHDLLDGTGRISSDYNNCDTEAGLAFAKIKAVYPCQTKALLVHSDPDLMAQEPAIRDVLGKVKCLAATDASTLFKELQHYVDSKEKSNAEDTRMEYWPLIKVVRIYCKAPALATGAVIVDLPGVQDSNAARAAVAANYLQHCTGIYITAAIQRAVDEKAAKVLLGDSFRRQLKFDGAYSAVTFICTKTDDMLVSEVSRSLNLDEELRQRWQQVESLQYEQNQHKQQIAELKDRMSVVDNKVEDLDAGADKWEELSTKLCDGEIVYKPNIDSPKKRKRISRADDPRKKHDSVNENSGTESGDDYDSNEEEDSQLDHGGQTKDLLLLTSGEIAAELSKIKAQKKDLRKSKKSIKEAIAKTKKELATLTLEEKTMRSEIKSVCVKLRNDYCRAAIKNEFAKGIKELDHEAAMAEDEANFNPDDDSRDYEAVAQSLPVFCVSARAYQKLVGRLQHDIVQVDGFPSADDTEIPRLQEHTRCLTETGRANEARRFLSDLDQLLRSMRLWASSDTGVILSKEDQEADEEFVRAQLASLRKRLQEAVAACIAAFHSQLAEKIYSAFERAIPKAIAKASKTANSWGAYRSGTGLHYCTYKATTRRSGVFTRNFNVELLDPVFRRISGPWERVFQRVLPSILNDLAKVCKRDISEFHSDTTSGIRRPTANPVGLVVLQQQLCAAIRVVDAAPVDLRKEISSQQRAANRGFTPVIQQAMQHAYDLCIVESGRGSYMRMKSTMISHIEEVRHTMFHQACQVVRQDLDRICASSEATMQELAKDLFTRIERDYLSVLVQGDLPDSEKKLRVSMRKDLAEADVWFTGLPQENVATFAASAPEPGLVAQSEDIIPPSERVGEHDHEHNNIGQQVNISHGVPKEMVPDVEPRPMWM